MSIDQAQPQQTISSKIPEADLTILLGSLRDDIETVLYLLVVDGDTLLYMSVSEVRQIERQPNRFPISWAQLIVKFRIEWIFKILIFDIC